MKPFKINHDYSETYVGLLLYASIAIYCWYRLIADWDYEHFSFGSTLFYIVGGLFFSKKLITLLRHPFVKFEDHALSFNWFGMFKKTIPLDQIKDIKYLVNNNKVLRGIRLKTSAEVIEMDKRFVRNLEYVRAFFYHHLSEDIQSNDKKPKAFSSLAFLLLAYFLLFAFRSLTNLGYIPFDSNQLKSKLPLRKIDVTEIEVTLADDDLLLSNRKKSKFKHPRFKGIDLGVNMYFQTEEHPGFYFEYPKRHILKDQLIAFDDTLSLPRGSQLQIKVKTSDYEKYIQPNSLNLTHQIVDTDLMLLPIYELKHNDKVLLQKAYLRD